MKIRLKFCLILTLLTLTLFSQNKKRSLDQLINKSDPGWTIVQDWISKARNKVEVLPVDTIKAKDALLKAQVTTRSPMGAIIYSSGGLLIDSGWIRILGSGNDRLNRSLPDWNKGKSIQEFGELPVYLLVADDAAGGFFAINGGGLGSDPGKMYYISPDNLAWEPLELTYSEFLNFCFNGDIADFYKNLRWTDWKADVAKLGGNQAYSFFPFLWTKEGEDVNKVSRKVIPVEEQFIFIMNMRKQLGLDKKGF